MAKKSIVFFCQSCGYEAPKWMGQCPGCHEWNTFVEEPVEKKMRSFSENKAGGASAIPLTLSQVQSDTQRRIQSGIAELDRVLGGGIVPASMVLVGGDPGIGKSTLLLQVCRNLSKNNISVMYISGEESASQIKMRAERIGDFSDTLKLYCETDLNEITGVIEREKPEVVVVDSIQTMYSPDVTSAPGSVSQVREATASLMRVAKVLGVSVFIVGHVTKEGTVAGPRVLEHMVDTVLYFEGDRYASYRILRGVKNRFGSTNEIGVFEMTGEGLSEVANPSEYMLSGRPLDSPGSVCVCSMEGTRPIMIEIQALVTRTSFVNPRRSAIGCDSGRVTLLIAVVEKRLNLKLYECDAYVNVTGGIKAGEPAADLGIVMSVISSYKNRPVPDKLICFGEVGLSGEIRAVSQSKARVMEAKKLGFESAVVPKVNMKELKDVTGITLIPVTNVRDAADLI